MKQMRHSRQRDAILNYLCSHHIHPPAEEVYEGVRQEMPNISLGTVYRNLGLLQQLGQIRAISNGTCAERFDGNLSNHHHLVCNTCGQVFDINLNPQLCSELEEVVFEGEIFGYDIVFHGQCKKCAESGT